MVRVGVGVVPHHQPVGVEVVVLAVGPGDQPFLDLLRGVGRDARLLDLPLEIHPQRPRGELLAALRIELAVLHHLPQHRVAAGARALGVEHRVVVGGALEHADQRRALQHVELVGRLVEVGPRGHLDAEGVVEEGHRVEVGLQDLLLGVHELDLQGRDRFLRLAIERQRAADLLRVEVARELLRDRRAALAPAAQRVQDRRAGAAEVDAVVLVEAPVLGGDQGIDHGLGDLRERHPLPVEPLEFGQHHAVGGHHHRRHLRPHLAQVRDAGRQGDQQQQVNKQQRRHQQHGAHGVAAGQRIRAARLFDGPGLGPGKGRGHPKESSWGVCLSL
jgi:hypothetical protein